MSESPRGHDLVVIGGGAGSLDALLELLRRLPTGLPAAVFVVLCQKAYGAPLLRLWDDTKLPFKHARDGEPIQAGRIYLPTPGFHLSLRQGCVNVARGPKENGRRPAIDRLFRTAAASYGNRVVAVLLGGASDCGVLGLAEVRRVGGICIVQDRREARFSDIVDYALNEIKAAELPIKRIASAIVELARRPPRSGGVSMKKNSPEIGPGSHSDVTCPECHGTLVENRVGANSRFRCHVGHSFSLASLAEEQAEDLEKNLWTALRAMRESEGFTLRMSRQWKGATAARLEERRQKLNQYAENIQGMLVSPALSVPALTASELQKPGQGNLELHEPERPGRRHGRRNHRRPVSSSQHEHRA